GQPDVGGKDIETALKLDPNSAEVYWAKAEIEEVTGHIDLAIDDLRRALALKPGFKMASDGLQRLGASLDDGEDRTVAGLGVSGWRVVMRGKAYFAVNDDYPRLRVPLEMSGTGQPRLLEWELKKSPLKGIGVLRFFGGTVEGRSGPEDVE